MALADLRAFAHSHQAGTRGTHDTEPTRSRPVGGQAFESLSVQGDGTRGTRESGEAVEAADTPALPDDGDQAERAAIIEFDGGIPRQWADGLARVLASPPPLGVAPATWRAMIDRAARFCDRWGAIAAAEGWTAAELFGLNPAAPFGRLDMRGAAFIGRDLEAVEITREAIVFRTPDGAIQRLRRRSVLAAPVWEGGDTT